MPVSEATYKLVALEDGDGIWELWCGRLVEKPPMTVEHFDVMELLYRALAAQLPAEQYALRMDGGRVRTSTGSYYVPDITVIPRELVQWRKAAMPGTLEEHDVPLPLVVEVWSPSTGAYDQTAKLAEYKRRGDLEVWLIHPYERTLTAWRKEPDDSYTETRYTEGPVQPASLPNVTIELATLFD